MKRQKYKIFKRRSDLIKYAIKRAIHRFDQKAKEHAKQVTDNLKETDWLLWAKRRMR